MNKAKGPVTMTCRRVVRVLLGLSLGLTLLAPSPPALATPTSAAFLPEPQPPADGHSLAVGDGHSLAVGGGQSLAAGDGHSLAVGDGHSLAAGDGLSAPWPPSTGFRPPALELSHLRGDRLPRGATAQSLPARWDWREMGKVTPVKDQMACNACYAFATAASLESRMLIGGAGVQDLSENQAKECNWWALNGNYGGLGSCAGGDPLMVANLWSQKGTVLESCDPYVDWEAPCNTTCPYSHTLLDWALLSGDVPADTNVLKWYIQNVGPLETGLYVGDGDPWETEFSHYQGTYTLYHPGLEPPNHSVLLVGWDDNLAHAGGKGAWIAKNSWGSYWGGSCGYGTEGGYFTIAYGSASIGQYSSFVRAWQDYDPSGEVLYYDDAGWNQSLGYGSTTAWGLARFVSPGQTWLTRVEFWTTDATPDVDVHVYDNWNGSGPRDLLGSALNLSYDEAGYHSVALSTPLRLSAGDEVIAVVKFTNVSYPHPIAVDAIGAHETGRTYLSPNGSDGSWADAGQSGADVAIRLRTSRRGGLAEPGTLVEPLPIACGQTVSDDTSAYPALISEYGICASEFTAPEVAYVLPLTYSAHVSITVNTTAALAALLLASADPADCLNMGGYIEMDLQAGTYYIVVDGLEAGNYELTVHCQALPTPTPTSTHTPTQTLTPTPTRTQTPAPTTTQTPTSTPTQTPTPSPTATRTPTTTPTVTATGTVTAVPSATPTAGATSTDTPTPTITPTGVPAGTFADPLPAACAASYSGNTSPYANNISDYGACGSGMSGPEVVYALDIGAPLAYVQVNFGGAVTQRLFFLSAASGASCLALALPAGSLTVNNLDAGRYFIVVDGTASGTYFFSVHCPAVEATPTPSPTLTAIATRTPTVTPPSAVTPTATPLRYRAFLPLALKRSARLSAAELQAWPEYGGR